MEAEGVLISFDKRIAMLCLQNLGLSFDIAIIEQGYCIVTSHFRPLVL